MNKKINKYTNRIFLSYIALGFSYLIFLFIFTFKILPGFFMQVMFLIDELLKRSKNIDSLLLSSNFVQTITFGLLALLLLIILIRGVIKSFKEFYLSRKYINSLNVISTEEKISLFKSDDYLVFTSGLISPEIFISKALKIKLTEEQYNAVMFHEKSHLKDHDPLRSFIVKFINNIMPIFPYKNALIDLFSTSIELKSDQNSENILGKKKPIIEALHSILKHKQINIKGNTLSSFSNMPERIPILVGKKKFNYKLATLCVSVMLVFTLTLPVVVFASSFYNCEHIDDCLQILINNLKNNNSKDLTDMHPEYSSKIIH